MENIFSVKDKMIVVTGATGILGHSFINALAEEGAIVGVLGRNEKVAKQRVNEIVQHGGKAIGLIADVTDETQLKAAKMLVLDKFGKIDGLVNAAGGNMPAAVIAADKDIFQLNFASLKEVMNLNLFGTILPTQIFGEAIARQGKGSIVNISSMASQRVITKVLGITKPIEWCIFYYESSPLGHCSIAIGQQGPILIGKKKPRCYSIHAYGIAIAFS